MLRILNKTCLTIFILFAVLQETQAQEFPQLNFENISTVNGLSDNIITCIYQDKKGFLWIGTANGLNKYDGLTFKTFFAKEGDPNSLSGNIIIDILEDNNGVFWIATRDGGITRYDPSKTPDKQFLQFRNDPTIASSIVSNRITAIEELDNDYIIFSCESAAVGFIHKKDLKITYNIASDSLHTIIDPLSGGNKPKTGGWIHYFYSDSNYLYLSQLGVGLQVYDIKSKDRQKLNFGVSNGGIQHFEVDKEKIWIASWGSGMYYQKNPLYAVEGEKAISQKLFETEEEISCVLSIDQDFLLAGSKGAGIYLMNKKDFSFIQLKNEKGNNFSLSSNRINCMLKDSKGIIWIGTTNGLNKFNPVQWQFKSYTITSDYDKDIIHYSIFAYDKNTLGICTSNGIYQFSTKENNFKLLEFQYENYPLRPTAVIELNKNNTYLTTESNAFHYDKNTHNIEILSPKQFYNYQTKLYYTFKPFRTAYQVYDVISDTIAGTEFHIFRTIGSGLGVYNAETQNYSDLYHINDSTSLSSNFVRVIYKDSQGNIWAGTSEGLNKLKKTPDFENTFIHYLHKSNDTNSISNNTITGIYEDAEQRLWISTGNGINEFRDSRFIHYSPDKTDNITMHGLYADEKNNLWTAVRGGFEVFDLKKKTFRFVPLINNSWLLKNPAQIFQEKGGNWYYGAGNQLICFDPESYYFETEFPKIYLSDFSVFDKSIMNTPVFNDLTFSHNNNFITVNFSCLQLSQPGTVKFKYQLKGLNTDWIDAGNSGKISFLSLPPGSYSLLIKVTNPQGDWSDEFVLSEFVILHPYWQQWWFIALCILTGAAIVYAIIRYREKQFLKLQMIRNNIANDLHDDVGSALSTINLYSEVAKMKSNEENEDLKNMLNKISDTSTEMQDNMNHIVWSLQPRNDNFEQMLLRMKSFALETLQIKNITTNFIVDEKLSDIKLTPDKRHELFLIFKEAINNIVKYANCSIVNIQLYRIKNKIVLEITDNGSGFDMQTKHAGNGLHSMQERSRKLKSKFKINSEIGKGTSISLIFEV
jgi:signal transduction histidine kinase/ligand-binding sensor domain-containing protein